jgi:adenylate cyclase
MLELCHQPQISKNRHKVQFAGHTWEIDVFHGANEGLVVAEVELASEDTTFEKPDWVLDEVSEDPRYFNSALLQKPFSSW